MSRILSLIKQADDVISECWPIITAFFVVAFGLAILFVIVAMARFLWMIT